MLIFEESNLRFEFNEDYQLIKSDENINFKNIKQYLPETKDIDFVGFYLQEKAFFLEVKNFKGSKPEDIDTLTTKLSKIARYHSNNRLLETVLMIPILAKTTPKNRK